MNTETTNAEKIRRLPWSIAHNATNSVFCYFTVFGTVFMLFLDELGLAKAQIGFLLSLFPFCGILALFVAPKVARAGSKRTFIFFWGIRKFAVACLLLTPWILSQFGLQVTFLYVTGILLVFAICRAIAETASYPWWQEIVPNSIRGKYGAVNGIVNTLMGCLAIMAASYVIGGFRGLGRFMVLIAVGVVFGLISVWCAFFIPGGAPIRKRDGEAAHLAQMMSALQDRTFLFYLGGIGSVLLGSALLAFVPLFLKEEVGLSSSNVILLQTGALLGGLFSGYLWGWAADRYGSKPVMLSGLHVMVLLPVCWLLIPRHGAWSVSLAMSIAFLSGLLAGGWGIGSNRLLYVNVVPSEKKTEYMAIYYAWMGLVGGCGPLIAGRALDYCQGMGGKFFLLTLDPYTPLFVASLVLLFAGALLLRGVRVEGDMPAGKFVGMFLRGKPLVAAESLLRYGLAKEESARVSTTERLGEAKSPLNVDELLEALSDPSFNVRYEAVISIARTRRDDRLLDGLLQVLEGDEPELSVAAAWALGRIGDKRALPPLRDALVSGYPMLRARSARALANLADADSIPRLLDCFRNESDDCLRVAYASALGQLRSPEATDELLSFLHRIPPGGTRKELTLALVRVAGNEHYFVRLWRGMRRETGTAASQAVLSLRKIMRRRYASADNLLTGANDCAEAFAQQALTRGTALLRGMIDNLPLEEFGAPRAAILRNCAERLAEFGAARIEYIALSLHTMNAGLKAARNRG